MDAEKCPICEGEGMVPSNNAVVSYAYLCLNCNGLGWVPVSDGIPVGNWPTNGQLNYSTSEPRENNG